MLDLEKFDFQRAFTPDYLHSVCLGVVRYTLLLLIKAKKTDAWYIGKNQMALLQLRLKGIKPPYEITRSQFKLKDIHDWKASQFRAFILYFVTLLDGILPEPFYSHFCSLSYGLFVLLQERVKKTAVQKLAPLFNSFNRDMEFLYGSEYVTYNVHLLPHIINTCLDWGLPWDHSTFIPEWVNGKLASSCSGTQCVAEQMAQRFIMTLQLRNEALDLMEQHKLPKNVLDLLEDLICLPAGENKKFNDAKGIQIINTKFLGRPVHRNLNPQEENAMSLRLITAANDSNWEFYPRIISKYGSIFTTKSYTRSPCRTNYCALMIDGNFIFIESFALNRRSSSCLVFGYILGDVSKIVQQPKHVNLQYDDFEQIPGQTTKFEGSCGSLIAYHIEEIKMKAVLASYNSLSDTGIVTALANRIESD